MPQKQINLNISIILDVGIDSGIDIQRSVLMEIGGFKMADEENKENIFKGFGDDKGQDKGSSIKFIVSVIAIVVVLGVFIYLVATLTGSKDPTTMAVADLSAEEQSAVDENQEALAGIGLDTVGTEATTEGADGYATEGATLTETTITNYLTAIKKVLELRESSKQADTLKIANTVADLNLYLKGLGSATNLLNPWQKVILLDAFATKDLTNADHQSIHSLIETYNYWDGKNTILFSTSLTKTNSLILDNYTPDTIGKWNEMIKCNGQCENFTPLLFELMGMMINK